MLQMMMTNASAVLCVCVPTVAALLFHFLLLVQSAPSGLSRLSVVSQGASLLLEKILRDVPALHAATVHIQVRGQRLDPPLLPSTCHSPAAPPSLPLAGLDP